MNEIEFESSRLIFKPMSVEYATPTYLNWLRDPQTTLYIVHPSMNLDDLKKYVDDKAKSNNCRFYAVFSKETNTHIGNVKLEPIDWVKKNTNFGILIGEKNYWGKGLASEITLSIVTYAFEKLKLEQVNLSVATSNVTALKVYQKIGFQIIRIESDLRINNKIKSDVMYLRLRHDDKAFHTK